MKVLRKNVYWPIVLLIIIQNYLSSEIFWILGLLLCVFEIVFNKHGKFIIPFKEYKILFFFLPWGVLGGFISYIQGNITIIDIIRDVFYYMNPLVFLYIGAKYAQDDISIYKIFNAFIISSAVLSIISYISIIADLSFLSLAISVYGWRKIVGDGYIVTGVALAISFANIIPSGEKLPRVLIIIMTLFSTSYFIMTLSRTNILIVATMYLVLTIQKKKSKKFLVRLCSGFIIIMFVLIVANKILPHAITSAFTEKMLSSLIEINASHSWTTDAEIQTNWRGYETSCAIKQWCNNNLGQQIFGSGFGTRVDVGNYAYTLLGQTINGVPASSIAVLHNGYATQLIKLGIAGVVVYIIFYFMILLKGWRHRRNKDTLETRVLIATVLIFLMQTYFLNGLFKDVVFLPTVFLVGFTAYKVERNKDIIQVLNE